MKLQPLEEAQMKMIGKAFGEIAHKYHMHIQSCAEKVDLSMYGIEARPCMNNGRYYPAIGYSFEKPKGKGVREQVCGCIASVDIGDYNCCPHECLYCYANYDAKSIKERIKLHDEHSSVLLAI